MTPGWGVRPCAGFGMPRQNPSGALAGKLAGWQAGRLTGVLTARMDKKMLKDGK